MFCEFCNQSEAEHYANTSWGDRHLCTVCHQSLTSYDDDHRRYFATCELEINLMVEPDDPAAV